MEEEILELSVGLRNTWPNSIGNDSGRQIALAEN
jgi:hypothetical protein